MIHVLLADDQPVMRVGIRAILEKTTNIQVVGEARDEAEVQQLTVDLRPQVLLLGRLGPRPAETVMWVRRHAPETFVVVLATHDTDAHLAVMVMAGAAGFLLNRDKPDAVVEAVRRAARGERFFSSEQLARAQHWQDEVGKRWETLTERERETMTLIVDGRSNKDIAEMLVISEHTVETHVGNLLDKLGVASRTEAATWAWRHGVVTEMGLSDALPPEKNGGFPG